MLLLNGILFIGLFWLICLLLLWIWKSSLLKKTWQEPYFADTPVLIESDDWGPGGDFHAERLENLLAALKLHIDKAGRPAVLTADIVLSVPDIKKIESNNDGVYFRTALTSFPGIITAMQAGIQQETFVPQLHGLEHLNGKAFAKLIMNQDPRIKHAQNTSNWWDWETLDSPLQGHYVDGSSLPTSPISKTDAENLVNTATQNFVKIFNAPSLSTVAPCYLWNDDIEHEWYKRDINIIQTAGYRCTGRDATGKYTQNPALIRVGDRNKLGQIYLVRNVMYEPVDGKNTATTAYQQAIIAYQQALPVSISTHRYNYTRSLEEHKTSLAGLNNLLNQINQKLPDTRFLSSPELGSLIETPNQRISNPFNKSDYPAIKIRIGAAKLGPFLFRLYYRHPKLVLASYITGLILPGWLICKANTRILE